MVPTIDHYVPLLRAVARLDRTSYEARGAIYDHALAIVMERLGATLPPCSQADIDQELLAFRAAVRRIEFGDMDDQDRIAGQAVADRAHYLATRRERCQDDTPQLDAYSDDGRQTIAVPAETLPAPAQQAPVLVEMAQRRSVLHRVAIRMVLPVLLVALGLAGYAHETGQFGQPFLGRILGQIAPTAWLAAG